MADIDRDVSRKVAGLPGVAAEQARAASQIKARAGALASTSVDTGNYAASFRLSIEPGPGGFDDYVVSNDDPAAVWIEYGHMTPASKNSPGRFVPGKHVLRRAIG